MDLRAGPGSPEQVEWSHIATATLNEYLLNLQAIERLRNLGSTADAVARRCVLKKDT